MSRGRGIGRYAEQLALAIEEIDPSLVGAYLLNPRLPPPAAAEALVASGKLSYSRQLPEGCRVLHLLSPLDLELRLGELWPAECDSRGIALSATVYDLIPLVEPSAPIVDAVERRRYRARLELLHVAAGLQVLSAAVRRQLVEVLGIPAARVAEVGAAPHPRFAPPAVRERSRQLVEGRLGPLGLSGPYLFCPSGSHPRKNNEAMIAAFAAATAGGPWLQLVLSAELDAPTVHHYRHLAEGLGIAERLVLPGYLDDETLCACYQAAELVCVPSLAEGYGLPVVEALACRTPVIASDVPALDELVPPDRRFDPRDVSAIATAIAGALDAPAPAAALPGWHEVATRAVSHLAALARSSARPRARPSGLRRRPRLALVTPVPPAATGVAGYSLNLVEALVASEKVEVDLFVDGGRKGRAPAGVEQYAARALGRVEALKGRYDEVLYAIGNSHHHLDAHALLAARPGVVLAHDVRLSNLYRHAHGDPGLRPGGFAAALHRLYPGLPAEAGANGELTREHLERYGLLMAREVIARSSAFLVSSSSAAALAREDALGRDAAKIAVLPFALGAVDEREGLFAEEEVARPEALGPAGALWGADPSLLAGGPLLASFGIVDPAKCPELLLAAAALLQQRLPDLHVALVGPVSDALAAELEGLARTLDLGEALVLTGPLPAARYRSWLARADLAVQLRAAFNGEASAAIGECLAAGVPTVATRSGFVRDLPTDSLATVEAGCTPESLAALLAALLLDGTERASLAAAGREAARQRSFAASARALLSYLERLPVRSAR